MSPQTPMNEEEPYFDYEEEEPDCDYCEGEGGDPLNDYCLPCPKCGRS